MDCNEARTRIAGYVDGELAAPEIAFLHAHLAGCGACRRERSTQSFIRLEVRRGAARFAAPAALRRRVRAALRKRETAAQPWWRRWSGPALAPAAGFAMAALLASNAYLVSSLPSGEDRLAGEIVTSHVRALVTARPIDVASSDRHTVKPWYVGKLDFSPPVADHASEGFALAGGRLDYVDGRAVAALVYRHDAHLVDVFIWPDTGAPNGPARSLVRRGYNLLHWNAGGMSHWIASDMDLAETKRLQELLAAADAR